VIAATFFGLLPLWFRIGRAILLPSAEVGWEAVLKDGLFLYFSMAIISAVTADYYLVDHPYPKYLHFYMMFMFPLILYVSCLFMIFLMPRDAMDGETYRRFFGAQVLVIVGACAYALFHKGRHILGIEEEEAGGTTE
jgi:hypothetical protein